MGSKSSKKTVINDTIGKTYICPICDKEFPPTEPIKSVLFYYNNLIDKSTYD